MDKGIEITLKNEDDFLKVKETLTRIGVGSYKNKKLYQSCHILHKGGRYYIVHFKEMFELDGRTTNTSAEDIARRNTIARLLQEWELVNIINFEEFSKNSMFIDMRHIKIIPYNLKETWSLESKYDIGRK